MTNLSFNKKLPKTLHEQSFGASDEVQKAFFITGHVIRKII